MKIKIFILLIIIPILISSLSAKKNFSFSQAKINKFSKKYGVKANKRILIWDKILQNTKDKSTLEKLKTVNNFFNKIKYKRDIKHWKKKDYWASPFEFLGSGAGDCEDYAIAKYFTLRQLGIPDKKLRITYVKLLQKRSTYEQAHMVLTYYHKPNSTPIVLDNVNKKLKLATKRLDLKPVYSFNASGLWKAKNKGKSSIKVGRNNLRSWKDLMNRI